MKFARYLRDTQTPEWKRAYIDYRALKKKITVIKNAQAELVASLWDPNNQLIGSRSDLGHNGDRKQPLPEADAQSIDAAAEVTAGEPSQTPGPSVPQTDERPTIRRSVTFHRLGGDGKHSAFPGIRSRKSQSSISKTIRGSHDLNRVSLPIHALRPLLSEGETAFFDALDAEFEKIESFYLEREKELQARTHLLTAQVQELARHRLRFYAQRRKAISWLPSFLRPDKGKTTLPAETPYTAEGDLIGGFFSAFTDQEEYQHAKTQLRKALIEHYRALEALDNYRILNVTGIRKALKKFEKTTCIRAMDTYMTEKVRTAAFSSGTNVAVMIQQVEEMFSTNFMNGDRKRAKRRLRVAATPKTHHFNTFRSGLFIGLAIPAFASGVHSSFQPETRAAIPGWNSLLQIYAVFLVPVLLVILVGSNVAVWAKSRINYVFIFELNPRNRLDSRQYFEMPGIALASLAYAFWLSFSQIGAPRVSPSIYPLVWLAFIAVLLVNPFPWYKSARYWTVRNVADLLTAGTKRVEFTDFWLGDQFCSLVFTLSSLPFVVCHYVDGYDVSWEKCSNLSRVWPASFTLATLPFLVRLVQSIRRYADSGLNTHLINGGKYGAGLMSYLFYFLWRHSGSPRHGVYFGLWVTTTAAYACYALTWDFLMDWSIFRPHATHKFLRSDVVYTNHIYMYYVAIALNTVLRFVWVIHIPVAGPVGAIRAFTAAILEIFRRWLWNFYRLENEHVGNMDQYRITREIPLPYSFGEPERDDQDADEDSSDD